MIELERLRIADFYTWLGCQTVAARELGCNQSTVSRRTREAARLARFSSSLEDADFLQLERRVHQSWRFAKGCDLRLHAYRWTNQRLRSQLPQAWRLNPVEVSVTQRSPLQLLQECVIDALLAPWPVVAELDLQRFALVPVYFTPLVLLTPTAAPLAFEPGLSRRDIARLSRLGRLDFVPPVASACSHHLDDQLFGASSSGDAQPTSAAPVPQGQRPERYWGTSLTPLIRPDLKVLPYPMPITYGEFLVCLQEWGEHGEMQRLQAAIHQSLDFLRRDRPGLETLALA